MEHPATSPDAQSREEPPSIVGLGASAGGLEALDLFLKHVPANSGLAFVVVQHLEPTHKALLTEILQRATPMPVVEVTGDVTVEPNHVYVIAPGTDLSILRGVLHALPPAEATKVRLPIDYFFRALAADGGDRAVGVILSGMGEDGTLGIRAIRENGGGTFAQDPASAKFDSMPRAAIDSGSIDGVYPPEELAGRIAEYVEHLRPFVPNGAELGIKDRRAIEKVFLLLRAQTGHDFSLYKQTTIHRRMQRRMGLHRIDSLDDYVRYLRENAQEADLLFKELLIGVTAFFRDPNVWLQLRDEMITWIRSAPEGGRRFRAWSAGCSTGEEAYTIAMIFKEALAEVGPVARCSLQVFATDLGMDAVARARAGVYPATIAKDVSEERLARFFVRQGTGTFCVTKEIRETVVFAHQNLVMHPPFTKLDLVVCRNLLIYLDAELQQKITSLFHFALNPAGLLLLGTSETAGPTGELFAPLPGRSRLYRRLVNVRPPDVAGFPIHLTSERRDKAGVVKTPPGPTSLQAAADQLLLTHFAPAAVLVTSNGDILYVHGKTGEYLEPAAGKANWNVFAMARGGLGTALSEAFHKAIRHKAPVVLEGISAPSGSALERVDITVQPITEAGPLEGMVLVAFRKTPPLSPLRIATTLDRTKADRERALEMAEELKTTREQLQAAREEMQASQEELRSANEELQSLNEELQATNEELTTSVEEAHAMNEELQVVNHETQHKLDELAHAGDDMKNLLDSVDLAIVFLDPELRVRRFTPSAVSIIKLIPTDVGRPVTDLVTVLDYPDLGADARAVLGTLVPLEKQVRTTDARWFSLRIMPYRTKEDRVDGTVITLSDITVTKNLESVLRRAPPHVDALSPRGEADGG